MLRRTVTIGLVVLVAATVAAGTIRAQVSGSADEVLAARLDAPIDSMSARLLHGWLEAARDQQAGIFVLEINTPGGEFNATRDMVGAILESPVPVVVFVTPPGARAASAGTFIVAAAHVAAMAPGTNIGAASPVTSSGDDLPETLKAKATQDAAALLRGIASERNRNSDALERTILEAASYSVEEAVDLNIVDLAAKDVADLLSTLDGRSVTVGGTERTLSTEGKEPQWMELTRVQRFMSWIANPQLVFIMLALGGILLLVEFISPGGWIPGITGAGLLILAFLGLGNLPVNWVGLVLIFAGLVLIFVELQAPGWGGFGAAGGISLIAGGFLLFGDTSVPGLPAPDVRVGFGVLGSVGVFIAVAIVGLWYFARQARGITVETRSGQLVGQTGIVRRELSPHGTVHVGGELWTAESESGETISTGETVVVAELDGIILKVVKSSSLDALERGMT